MVLHPYCSGTGRNLIYEYLDSLPVDEQVDGYTVLQYMEKGEFDKIFFKPWERSLYEGSEASVYKGYKRDKIEMRGERAEMSDFPLYLNTVAGGLDCRNQTIGGFSFVVKIYAVPVVEIIG